MARLVAASLLLCLGAVASAQDLGNGLSIDGALGGDDLFGGFVQQRDDEALPGPIGFGPKYMTGGAGEGTQHLTESEGFQHREQVKSDAALPAYCEPPNPCPVGFTAEHGCLEEFENSAEFSRAYQSQQHCICDQEHMFNCADKEATDSANNLQGMLDEEHSHAGMIAKKFHDKRSGGESFIPRRKRSIDPSNHGPNPYLQGQPLRSMQKKDGRKSW